MRFGRPNPSNRSEPTYRLLPSVNGLVDLRARLEKWTAPAA
ncbi:hypothetical protein HMPREF0724_14968 [Prescottella equi ATCC 33707]|uniref:Uncharacterized protein n=1 Tax=Prescottella equi ATCC 33707 TaxID=525370 RepID=E9T862_RHOHA|nr:hypothetical protein HMPREF0724_14968 [Prescottella equi ATCC 33707]